MGEISPAASVLLLLAVSSRHDVALTWARQRTESVWGETALASTVFAFTETDYYDTTMGTSLKKQFLAIAGLIDPADLPELKTQANLWEAEYAAQADHAEPRPLNLDPGYITLGKLVLASTKDHAHRIYLRDGIYAEVTLYYKDKRWQASSWTYPDYQRGDYQEFFTRCREYFKGRRQQEPRV